MAGGALDDVVVVSAVRVPTNFEFSSESTSVVVIGSVSFLTIVMFGPKNRFPVGVDPSSSSSIIWGTRLSPGANR